MLEGIILYIVPTLTFGGYCIYYWTNRDTMDKLTGLHIASAIAFVLVSVFWIPRIPPYPRRYLEFYPDTSFRPPLQIAIGMLAITMIIFSVTVYKSSTRRDFPRVDGGA